MLLQKIKQIKHIKVYMAVLIFFAIICFVIRNVIFISLPFTPKIKASNNEEIVMTASQEKAFIQHYKNMVDYYNGIVLGKYTIEEFLPMYYDSLNNIEREVDKIGDSMEISKFKVKSSTYWNTSIYMGPAIDMVRLKYEYREYSKQEAQREIKKIIKQGIRENVK